MVEASNANTMVACPVCEGTGEVPKVYPRVIKRDRDLGWMALSPEGYRYRIGATGSTEKEAVQLWYKSAARFEELGRRALEGRRELV